MESGLVSKRDHSPCADSLSRLFHEISGLTAALILNYRHNDTTGFPAPFDYLPVAMGNDLGHSGFLFHRADKGKAPACHKVFKTQPYVFKTGSAVMTAVDP